MSATPRADHREPPVTGGDAPAFPLESFPPWFRAQVESVAHRLQVSPDMPAVFGLSVLSAAVGSTLRVRAWRGFEQPALVWTVTAAASGENKSATVDAMKAPVVAYHRGRREQEAPDFARTFARYELLKRQAEALATKATKGGGDMQEAEDAMVEAAESQPKPVFRLTFDSATTEALIKQLVDHGFLAHLESEGDVFHDIVGRYDSGGLLKQYLDAFDGGAIDLDRVGRGNIRADRVGLVIGVMLQPDMLADVMREGRFKGRGLLERCLFAMPASLVGRRDMRPLEGDARAEEEYMHRLLALCEQHHGATEPRVLTLSTGAQRAFVAYRERGEARLVADLSGVVSWVNKAIGGMALRVAGLLAVAWDRDTREVSAEVMQRAATVMETYFIPQALRTFGDLRGDASGHTLRQVEPWLQRQNGEFTARDLQRTRGDLFASAEDVRTFLDGLVAEGRLVHVSRPRTSKSGPLPQRAYRHIRQITPTSPAAQPRKVPRESPTLGPLSDLSDLSGGPRA